MLVQLKGTMNMSFNSYVGTIQSKNQAMVIFEWKRLKWSVLFSLFSQNYNNYNLSWTELLALFKDTINFTQNNISIEDKLV